MKSLLAPVVAAWGSLIRPTAAYVDEHTGPTVSIASGTIVGKSSPMTENFNGIPFAQPPTGPLRLKPPVKLQSSLGTFDATGVSSVCPQFPFSDDTDGLLIQALGTLSNSPLVQAITGASEDCLTLDVIRPVGTTADDKLPVLFWIHGGGFENGSPGTNDGTPLVGAAALMGKPYIFVAVGYRLGGFGFLPGSEVLADGSANLGLLDQRMGLEWVADNVAAFGGDPTKVTIWGESAGAISVFNQLAIFDGNISYHGQDLFRGAIMNSGNIIPADPVDCPKSQAVYDAVVIAAGCSSAADTLDCLRILEYQDFLSAANSVPSGFLTYHSVALSYLPRPDGTVLTASPEMLVAKGQYAAVPMIVGDQEDEGTLLALAQSNITTTDDLISYLSTIFYNDATTEQLTALVATYPDSPDAGSPFRTGNLNEIYPGFKRLAAIIGDVTFTLMRRVFLNLATISNPSVPSWSYLASYNYGTPIQGTSHASDQAQLFYGIQPNYASKAIQSYYANFVYNLNPNDATGGTSDDTSVVFDWPQWTANQQLVQFHSSSSAPLSDNFRSKSYSIIKRNLSAFYI